MQTASRLPQAYGSKKSRAHIFYVPCSWRSFILFLNIRIGRIPGLGIRYDLLNGRTLIWSGNR